MIKNRLFIALTFFNFNLSSQLLGSYGFADVTSTTGTVDPTPPPMAIGLTFGSFSAVGTSSNPNASGRFSFTGWPLGAQDMNDTLSSMTATIDLNTYYTVDIIPVTGYSVTLNSISFFMRRSATGIRNYSVRSSADGYSANLPASVGTNTKLSVISPDVFFWNYDAAPNSSDQRGSVITLGGPLFTNFTNVLSLRFYAWNAEQNSGTFGIDSVVFNGSATNSINPPNLVGIETLCEDAGSKIKVYPNPAANEIVILKTETGLHAIEVISASGAVVLSQKNIPPGNNIKLDLSALSPGTYFIKIDSPEGSFKKKLIIVK